MTLVDIKYTPMRFLLTLAVLVFCCVLHCSAQRNVKDSLQYYSQQLNRLYRKALESLDQNDSARYYRHQLKREQARARDYVALSIFTGLEAANYKTFNAAIAKDGFAPMRGSIFQFGAGASFRGFDGLILDLNFIVAGIGTSTYGGAASIRNNSSETLNVQIGYAIINTGRLSFYPYVGFADRFSELSYSTPDTANPNYNSIGSLLQGGKSVNAYSDVVCYQAGVGVDWIIQKIDNNRRGVILFGKLGTDGAFGHETYPIANVTYDPGIRYGAWVAQIGFKFFLRS